MTFFKKIIFLLFITLSTTLVVADNHETNTNNTNQELIDQAKEITQKMEDMDDEVPLNDPFAGNEGTSSQANIPEEEKEDMMSLYNFKLAGLISGVDYSYISLVDSGGEVITLSLGQNLGKIKLVDLRLNEAIFQREDKSYIIIDFNNQIRESNEY